MVEIAEVDKRRSEIKALAVEAEEAIREANKLGVFWRAKEETLNAEQTKAYHTMIDASAALQSHCGDLVACVLLKDI